MGDMGMLVELGSAFSVLARVIVSSASAMFLAYVIYVVGMLAASSVLRAVRRHRRRRASRPAGVPE